MPAIRYRGTSPNFRNVRQTPGIWLKFARAPFAPHLMSRRTTLQRHDLHAYRARLPVVVLSHVSRRTLTTLNSHEPWQNDRRVIAESSNQSRYDNEDALRRKRRTDWKRRQQVNYFPRALDALFVKNYSSRSL